MGRDRRAKVSGERGERGLGDGGDGGGVGDECDSNTTIFFFFLKPPNLLNLPTSLTYASAPQAGGLPPSRAGPPGPPPRPGPSLSRHTPSRTLQPSPPGCPRSAFIPQLPPRGLLPRSLGIVPVIAPADVHGHPLPARSARRRRRRRQGPDHFLLHCAFAWAGARRHVVDSFVDEVQAGQVWQDARRDSLCPRARTRIIFERERPGRLGLQGAE